MNTPTPAGVSLSAPEQGLAKERRVILQADRVMRVYIAGPMTGLPEFNFPAFNAMAEVLRADGWHVENPAEHGHVDGAEWADYLRYDISRLSTCSAMMLLPGWSSSRGARLEVSIAKELGHEMLYAVGAEQMPSDFDRVTADADRLRAELECSRGDFAQLERISERLQARLNTADQTVDEMVTLLNLAENILSEHRQISPGYDWISNTQQDREEMRKQIAEYLANMCAPNDGQCQLPQSCTSNCPCKTDDIPDFTPGNGNRARRRAAAIEALKPENQRITPIDHGTKAGFCDCNQGRLPCTCKASAYDGFDNGVD